MTRGFLSFSPAIPFNLFSTISLAYLIMSRIEDGVYIISVPFGPGCITDPGEGRWVPLVPHNALGKDADKIIIQYNHDRGAFSLQFENSKKYITFDGIPSVNNKLKDGEKPRYFKIERHEFASDKYAICVAENKHFHVGMAMERVFPPWIAMSGLPRGAAVGD
ncbi:transmembrane protein, putative [Rhizoctonia solani AG-3 Rhs1AP]|uniref:Transmembrane protein, putative n=1 Tax=Rhizoctonia solani AG-3 Rhs1AP TaxID=1086054 RepID=X8JDQ1_9AGAM|nr:transmembrane protein, putative [Rhizoctonia solani AG-3 Rhs1AP]